MKRMRVARLGVGAAVLALVGLLGPLPASPVSPGTAYAVGVGGATWTPASSDTRVWASRFLLPGDSLTFTTRAGWNRAQVEGLERYVAGGLRYTHEVNDRSGRLSATGYWATDHPDAAYDRDDDDGDGRWEEAEITVGAELPRPGHAYTTVIQFSRWHGKPTRRSCEWSWDRRRGYVEVLSQLSRELLGEWQAERYTLDYDVSAYPRVGTRPAGEAPTARPECGPRLPGDGSLQGVVVTFRHPVAWDAFLALESGAGRWSAYEAIGSRGSDDLPWTCGGPVEPWAGLEPCRQMGVAPDGVVAATGWLSVETVARLSNGADVARVDPLRDSLTGLLADVGGFGVEAPDLTVDDAYWELILRD